MVLVSDPLAARRVKLRAKTSNYNYNNYFHICIGFSCAAYFLLSLTDNNPHWRPNSEELAFLEDFPLWKTSLQDTTTLGLRYDDEDTINNAYGSRRYAWTLSRCLGFVRCLQSASISEWKMPDFSKDEAYTVPLSAMRDLSRRTSFPGRQGNG